MYAKAHTLDIAVPSDNERALRWSNMLSRTQFSSKIWFTFYARVHHKARLLSGGGGDVPLDANSQRREALGREALEAREKAAVASSWECPNCGISNMSFAPRCGRCRAAKAR